MAKNIVLGSPNQAVLTLTGPALYPTTPASGDPVIMGTSIPGVALFSEDADSEIVACIGPLVAELSVKGIDGNGNSSVTHGQKLYYVDGDDPVLSKKATGLPFGLAWETTSGIRTGDLVAAGATTTIRVLVYPANGILSLTAGSVDQSILANSVLQQDVVEVDSEAIVGTDPGQLGHGDGVVLVEAPGAGKVLELISVVGILDYSTKAYTGGGNTTINWAGGAAITGLVSHANFVGGGADKIVHFLPLADAAKAMVANSGINLVAAAAPTQPDTAAGTLKLIVTYRVHTL